MLLGDFHTHSTLDDGKSTLEEMAAAAYDFGVTHFGFPAIALRSTARTSACPKRMCPSTWRLPENSRKHTGAGWKSLWAWSWTTLGKIPVDWTM